MCILDDDKIFCKGVFHSIRSCSRLALPDSQCAGWPSRCTRRGFYSRSLGPSGLPSLGWAPPDDSGRRPSAYRNGSAEYEYFRKWGVERLGGCQRTWGQIQRRSIGADDRVSPIEAVAGVRGNPPEGAMSGYMKIYRLALGRIRVIKDLGFGPEYKNRVRGTGMVRQIARHRPGLHKGVQAVEFPSLFVGAGWTA